MTEPIKNRFFLLVMMLASMLSLTSCSEEDNEEEEFPDWQVTNETYFTNLYNTVKALEEQNDTATWRLKRCWSMIDDDEYFTADPEDNIIVEVLEEGAGSGCPIYTDNVWVHYKGRLLPSTSYPEGYVFDQSYYGDFNEETAIPTELAISDLVDGFATAVQKMHIGDYWRVYIPHQLGYGETGATSVPAYSTLIFEIRLAAYAREDADLPITW